MCDVDVGGHDVQRNGVILVFDDVFVCRFICSPSLKSLSLKFISDEFGLQDFIDFMNSMTMRRGKIKLFE